MISFEWDLEYFYLGTDDFSRFKQYLIKDIKKVKSDEKYTKFGYIKKSRVRKWLVK